MKNVLFALVASFAINASAAQYVTVTVCDGGESGQQCREVTYKVRPPSAPVKEECTIPHGEAGTQPCPKKYGVPGWLKKLNQWAIDHGLEANEPDDSLIGGP